MINPIFESGARRRMRTVRTPVILTAYMAALLVFSLCMLTDFMGQGIRVATMRLSTEWTIWATAFQFFLIALVAPALGAGCIAGERERQTFDLLLVTGVGTRKIVLGKLMENYLFLLLLIFSGLPVLMLANMTGGYRVVDLLVILLYLAVIALAALAVGMVMSVLFRRSLTAIIAAYLAIFAIGGGTWALALRGPLAAQYTYEFIDSLSLMDPGELLFSLPVTIYLCPPVVLVMLLGQPNGNSAHDDALHHAAGRYLHGRQCRRIWQGFLREHRGDSGGRAAADCAVHGAVARADRRAQKGKGVCTEGGLMQETGGITCTNLPDLTEYDRADRTYGVRFALFCQSEGLTSLRDGDKI